MLPNYGGRFERGIDTNFEAWDLTCIKDLAFQCN